MRSTIRKARQLLGYYREKDGSIRKFVDIGRNKNCPCGSGVKYKKCCQDFETLADKIQEMKNESNN